MAFYNNRSLTLDRGFKRSPRQPFAAVGRRLASTFRATEDVGAGGNDQDTLTDLLPLRFPIVRRGYDRDAVDDYVSQLETELAALDQELAVSRGGATAREVETEIKRIGEQTSAVLMAAHEQREEILQQARAEAERCVADASAQATALATESEQRLRDLGAQTQAAQAQRQRLVDELRTISAGLSKVVDAAT